MLGLETKTTSLWGGVLRSQKLLFPHCLPGMHPVFKEAAADSAKGLALVCRGEERTKETELNHWNFTGPCMCALAAYKSDWDTKRLLTSHIPVTGGTWCASGPALMSVFTSFVQMYWNTLGWKALVAWKRLMTGCGCLIFSHRDTCNLGPWGEFSVNFEVLSQYWVCYFRNSPQKWPPAQGKTGQPREGKNQRLNQAGGEC